YHRELLTARELLGSCISTLPLLFFFILGRTFCKQRMSLKGLAFRMIQTLNDYFGTVFKSIRDDSGIGNEDTVVRFLVEDREFHFRAAIIFFNGPRQNMTTDPDTPGRETISTRL